MYLDQTERKEYEELKPIIEKCLSEMQDANLTFSQAHAVLRLLSKRIEDVSIVTRRNNAV